MIYLLAWFVHMKTAWRTEIDIWPKVMIDAESRKWYNLYNEKEIN